MSRKANKAMKRMKTPENFGRVNDSNFAKREAANIADNSLFSVNIKKGSRLKSERQKLAEDRFIEKLHLKDRTKSKTEMVVIDRIRYNEKYPKAVVKKVVKPDDEYCDPWATPQLTLSKKAQEFKAFSKTAMPAVKAVMIPEAGQSFNPKASDHISVLKKVVNKEA